MTLLHPLPLGLEICHLQWELLERQAVCVEVLLCGRRRRSSLENFAVHGSHCLFDRVCGEILDEAVAPGDETGCDGHFAGGDVPERHEVLVKVCVCPGFRTILDEYLLGGVWRGGAWRATYRANEAGVHVVGECAAHLTLDLGETILAQGFLCVLKLLELHESEIEVLEQRSINKIAFIELSALVILKWCL